MIEPANGTATLPPSLRQKCANAVRQLTVSQPSAKSIQQLRGQFGQPLADLLLSVAELQKKAFRKLDSYDRSEDDTVWWVTRKALQQATPWQVAQLKSQWFGDRPVMDLCCGIGGDAVALSRRGRIVAVDSDPLLTELVEANLETFGGNDFDVSCADASGISIAPDFGVHIDPDRRIDGSRTTRPQDYQPPWDDVVTTVRRTAAAVIKLAPVAQVDLAGLQAAGCFHRCWISLQRTVREQSLLCGSVIDFADFGNAVRGAIAVDAAGRWNAFAADEAEFCAPAVDDQNLPTNLIVDPDPAIRAAELTNAYASHHRLRSLGGPQGFLTTDEVASGDQLRPLSICGEVIWQGACDERKIRHALRQHDARVRTVKVRGTQHDPAVLIKRLGKTGDRPMTLWIGRTQGATYAAMTP